MKTAGPGKEPRAVRLSAPHGVTEDRTPLDRIKNAMKLLTKFLAGAAMIASAGGPAVAGSIDGFVDAIDEAIFDNIFDFGCCAERDCGTSWIGGVEATFFDVEADGSGVVSISTGPLGNLTRTVGTDLSDFHAGPRVWFGAEKADWQIVARYWDFDAGSEGGFDFAAIGPVASNSTGLDLLTVDLEVARKFDLFHCDDARLFFGARYAEFDVGAAIATREVINTTTINALAAANTAFSGPGLTFGGSGVYPIGCHGFELFWAGRGSVIFGDSAASALTAITAVNPIGRADTLNFATGHADDDVFVTEIQIGAQYRRPLRCVDATVFIRGAFEYQHWTADEGFAVSASFANTTDASATATALAGGVDIDLVGFVVGAGLNW
ncbi:MAG: Lpg1974 family pore-forming outer membrane protein [Planctomycetota bacterium]